MITAWPEVFRQRFGSHKRDFVSLDAKQDPHLGSQQYELSKFAASPRSGVTSPSAKGDFDSHYLSDTTSPEYLSNGSLQREYNPPQQSFSAPLSPTRTEWNPQSTYARGGLGLHPPLEEDEKHRDRF